MYGYYRFNLGGGGVCSVVEGIHCYNLKGHRRETWDCQLLDNSDTMS